jgi:hypothetical protein
MNRPGGLLIRDKRPKAPRPCLVCSRPFLTTAAGRICAFCKKRRSHDDPLPDIRLEIPRHPWR